MVNKSMWWQVAKSSNKFLETSLDIWNKLNTIEDLGMVANIYNWIHIGWLQIQNWL